MAIQRVLVLRVNDRGDEDGEHCYGCRNDGKGGVTSDGGTCFYLLFLWFLRYGFRHKSREGVFSITKKVLIPRRPFFTYDFPFASSVGKVMSSHQQDLPATTPLRGGSSFGRLAEWQLAADRDHQFAISEGLGHGSSRRRKDSLFVLALRPDTKVTLA